MQENAGDFTASTLQPLKSGLQVRPDLKQWLDRQYTSPQQIHTAANVGGLQEGRRFLTFKLYLT